jgi:NMD protein affecting ribosome stability and mRNA decay
MPRGRPTDVDKTGQYGKFRERRLRDPYIPVKGWPEPTICPRCEALYAKKRWQFSDKLLLAAKNNRETEYHKCPACHKIEDGYPMGIINLSGPFVAEHREELVSMLKSEERRAMQKNPLERFIKIEKRNGGLYAETTSDALALRVGHLLTRAYKGKHEYHWRSGDKYVEIDWRREL